jgi:predicted metal-dependent HD superfamily phosphohydrolase
VEVEMRDAQVMQLRDRFMRLVASTLDHQVIASGWFEILLGLYQSKGRYYHTLDHIADLLARLDARDHSGLMGNRLEIEMAIWFHDAIYDVRSTTNEDDSAQLAASFFATVGIAPAKMIDHGVLRYRDNSIFAGRVLDAIEATKHTGVEVIAHGARVMLDLDLAGLADPWERFDENNAKIRREYAIYNDEQWRWGRAKFVTSILARPHIFYGQRELEKPARENLQRHLRDLVG